MYTVLIADDEAIIRRGLKKIINWNQLGYSVIGEASDGEEALVLIKNYNPDVVLIDIRMPLLDGLEVIQSARACNFTGKIIIISGYSDFTYAQKALRYDVKYYLTKPIDEIGLEASLKSLYKQLQEEALRNQSNKHYREKAKNSIIKDWICGKIELSNLNLAELNMTASTYQVIIYEKYSRRITDISYNFSELLKVTNQDSNSYDSISIDNNEVIILKGDFSISQFNKFLEKFGNDLKPQKDSPLDTLFIAYGRVITSPLEIRDSYLDAYHLLQRRFFCEKDQHTIGYDKFALHSGTFSLTEDVMNEYITSLVDYIQSFNKNLWMETIKNIESKLQYSQDSIAENKLFLTDLFLQVKDKINNLYAGNKIPFPSNSQIINFIDTRNYLYEIISFFAEQFDLIMNAVGSSSNDSVVDSVIYYIKHNYMDNIKLESMASLYGYNSCYLGKMFHDKTGESFNSYVDSVRIENSIRLLQQDTYKIYEIAEKVGYRNVEYFYLKFKKYTNVTPSEFRKQKSIG